MYMNTEELLKGLKGNVIPGTDTTVTNVEDLEGYFTGTEMQKKYFLFLKSDVRHVDDLLLDTVMKSLYSYLEQNSDNFERSTSNTIICIRRFFLSGGITTESVPMLELNNPILNLLPTFVRHDFNTTGTLLKLIPDKDFSIHVTAVAMINNGLSSIYSQRHSLDTIKHYSKLYRRGTIVVRGCKLKYEIPESTGLEFKMKEQENYKIFGQLNVTEPIKVYVNNVNEFDMSFTHVTNDEALSRELRNIFYHIESKLIKVRLSIQSYLHIPMEEIILIIGPTEINKPDQGVIWVK